MVKKYSKCALAFLWLTIIMNPLHGQVKHSHDIVLGFLQIKDEIALGEVYKGVQLEYRYGLHWKINNHEILYQPKLGYGIGFKRKMTAEQFHLAPVNLTWTVPFYERNEHTIRVGTNFIMDYNYHNYTEIHDDPLFWNAEIGLSPVIRYSFEWDNKRINAGLQNSLIGFSSRRQGYDPYFWGQKWKDDIILNPHKDMKFGSFNNYNHTKLSLEFVPNISKIHSVGYEFDYLGVFYGNKFHRINHNLIWRISL